MSSVHHPSSQDREGQERADEERAGTPLPSAGAVARTALGMARAGEPNQAVRVLRQRLERGALSAGEVAELRLVLARVLLDADRAKAAVAELVEVLKIDAHRPDALLLLAESLIVCDEGDKARDILDKARSSGADAGRVDQLRLRLDGKPWSPNPDDSLSVLISDDDHRPARDPFASTDKILKHRPLAFSDDELTMPWVGGRKDDLDEKTHRALYEPALLADDEMGEGWDFTDPSRVDPELGLDTAPRQDQDPMDSTWEDPTTSRAVPEHLSTSPRAWSIGDPGRAATSPAQPPPLRFDEDTVTGSFDRISGEVLKGLDEEVRRHLSSLRSGPTPILKKPAAKAPAEAPADGDPFWAPTPRAANLPPLGLTPPIQSEETAPARSLSGPVPALGPPRAPPPQPSRAQAPQPKGPPSAPVAQVPAMQAFSTKAPPARSPSSAIAAPASVAPARPTPIPAPANTPAPRQAPSPPARPSRDIPVGRPAPAEAQIAARRRHHQMAEVISGPEAARPATGPAPRGARAASKPLVLPHGLAPAASGLAPEPLRQPDLMDKLDVAARRQKIRATDTDRLEQEESAPQRGGATLLLSTLLAALLLISLVVGLLFVYPALHYRALVAAIDADLASARQQESLDTFTGYKDAAAHLQAAVAAQGPVSGVVTDAADGYLELIGVQGHARRRVAARARLARAHAILETRYGLETTPSATLMLAEFEGGQGADDLDAISARSRLLLQGGKFDEAAELLNHYRPYHPGSIEVTYLLGEAMLGQGKDEEARARFEEARGLDTQHIESRLALARWYATRKDDKARLRYDEITSRLSSEHAEAIVERALFEIERGDDLEKAKVDLSRLISHMTQTMSPREKARAHHAMARYHQRVGALDVALASLDEARRLDPAFADAALSRVAVLLEADRLEEAQAALGEAQGRFGERPRSRGLRAGAAMLGGRPDKALEPLAEVIERDGEAMLLKGQVLLELGRWVEAERVLDKAMSADPRGAAASDLALARAIQGRDDAMRTLRQEASGAQAASSWRYGVALLGRGKAADSVPHLERAERLDPEGRFRFRLPPSYDLCRAHAALGALDKAREKCQRALASRPAYLPPHLLLADIETRESRPAAALEALGRALLQSPDDRKIRRAVTRAQIALGRFDEADASLKVLLNDDPQDKSLLALQGFHEFRRHRHERAIGYFKKALEIEPNDAEIHLSMAWSLMAIDRRAEARPHIDLALKEATWGPRAAIALAEHYRLSGDPGRAIATASAGLRLLRQRGAAEEPLAEAHTILALSYEAQHNITHSTVQQELTAAALSYAPAWYHRARVACARRDTRVYHARLQKAVDLDPYFCPAVERLREEAGRDARLGLRVPDTCRP